MTFSQSIKKVKRMDDKEWAEYLKQEKEKYAKNWKKFSKKCPRLI